MTGEEGPTASDRNEAVTTSWQEPTIYDAFVDGATGRVPGTDVVRIRNLILSLAMLVLTAALIPSIRSLDRVLPPGISVLVIAAVQAVRAGNVQGRLGRSGSHATWAGLGVVSIAALVIGTFILASLVLGQPLGQSPLERLLDGLSSWIGIAAIVVLFVGAVIGTLVLAFTVGKRRRARYDAEVEAAIRSERSARAQATGRETVDGVR